MERRESKKIETKRMKEVLVRLENNYMDAKPELTFASSYELLIAVMLSAQCTDKRVNVVTQKLFENYNTPEKMLQLSADALESMIRSCGLSPTKSKNILATTKIIVEQYGAQVPSTIELLQTLPGVGRKTANVVASVAFGVPAIAVDTHVFRVSNRIGLAQAKNVENTEKQLKELIAQDKWSRAHHWLIFHGRRICTARAPRCAECFLNDVCTYALDNAQKSNKEK